MTPMMAMSAVTVIAPGPGLRSFTSTCGVRGPRGRRGSSDPKTENGKLTAILSVKPKAMSQSTGEHIVLRRCFVRSP